MVPYRGITNRRALLPAEQSLIETLGCTKEEYFQFLEDCHYASIERGKEYALIPDVRNDPVSLAINLVIGLALTAVSALLAPKPSQQQQDERRSIKTADQKGRDRFTPYESFGSVQELATLGKIIPLIYTRRGVRVNGQLLWSHLDSQGSSQLLRAIVLFGNGITGRPSFDGFAIGDQLIKNYGAARMRLFFSSGERNIRPSKQGYSRLLRSDQYEETQQGDWAIKLPNDPFTILDDEYLEKDGENGRDWYPYFSGTRNVNANAEFGVHSPIPNGHVFRLPYELVLIYDGNKQAKEDARKKNDKIRQGFSSFASLVQADNEKASSKPKRVNVKAGEILKYRIADDQYDPDKYQPWGLTDVNGSINARRIEADERLQIGEVFQVGDIRAVVVNRPSDIWDIGEDHEYQLRAIESGVVYVVRPDATVEMPTEISPLMRVNDGVVTNNRDCNITEIGLKSTVWKQITSFANVNSEPDESTLKEYEREGDQIQLGQMAKYLIRYSFFRVCVRPKGGKWQWLTGDKLLCIRGNTPQAKYNSLRIHHPEGQHEYKIVPVTGSQVMKRLGTVAFRLQHTSDLYQMSSGDFDLYINASPFTLGVEQLSNPEWIRGKPPTAFGNVETLKRPVVGRVPSQKGPGAIETKYHWDPNNRMDKGRDGIWEDANQRNYQTHFYWDGKRIKSKRFKHGKPHEIKKDGYKYWKGEPKSGGRSWEIKRQKIKSESDGVISRVTVNKLVGDRSNANTAEVRSTEWKKKGRVVAYTFELAKEGSGYFDGENARVDGIRFDGKNVSIKIRTSAQVYGGQENLNPYDAILDYFKYDAERSSHQDGPEHSIAFVNEILDETDLGAEYEKLAIAGVAVNSGYEFNSFNSISAYFTEGMHAEDLYPARGIKRAVNTLPEIAYDLLTNKEYGVGELVGREFVDKSKMAKATEFCTQNGFFWDGVITEQVAIRDFLYQQAAYCMMQFCCFSGTFFLQPAFPVHSDGRVHSSRGDGDERRSKAVDIAGLFTDGNMRGFEITFLPPEQRQSFKAELTYREESTNGFPEVKTIHVALKSRKEQGGDKPGGSDNDPTETFDLTQFCINEEHAIRFAKYALRVRTLSTHTCSFETTPEMAQGVKPGDFIRVMTEYTHFSRFDTGSVAPDGSIQSPMEIKNGRYPVFYWTVGTIGVKNGTMTVSGGKTTQSQFKNSMFCVRGVETKDRVYQVESLEFGETDGMVKLIAVYTPVTNGKLQLLDWDDDDFEIVD
jgi:hypothetical protein